MPIEFKCPTCNVSIRVPDVHAGKKGHCPSCKTTVRIPAAGASNSTEIEKVKSSPGMKSPAPSFITFTCPSCDKRTGFPANLAGKAAPCPVCQANIMVPAEANGASFVVGSRQAPADHVPEETPLKKSPLVWAVGGLGVAGVIFAIAFIAGKMGQSSTPTSAASNSAPAQTSTRVATAESQKTSDMTPVAPTAAVHVAAPAIVPVASPALPPPVSAPAKHDDSDPRIEGKEAPVARSPENETKPADTDTSEARSPFAGQGSKTPAAPSTPAVDDMPDTVAPKKAPAKVADTVVNDAPDDMPAETAKPKQDPAADKKVAAAKPVDAQIPPPAKPVAPPPACPQCLGTGYLPLLGLRPYIHAASEPINALTASNAVAFRFCTKCGVGKDPKSLVEAETARLANVAAVHKKWEEQASSKLSYVETHHVTLRSTLPESELKIVAAALEQLTGILQNSALSTVLAQTRPETDQILIGADQGGYLLFLDALKAQDPKGDWSLAKESTGFMLPHMAVFNAQRGGGMGARSMALYQFGEMLIMRATENKAPAWLRLGFASYCENIITKKNLVYAFQYEKNEVHFGENWDAEIKKFAAQSKLKTWDMIFLMSPVGASAIDYLTSYSMVNFFITTDPKLFPKLVIAIRDGLDSEHAVQKVYSSDYKRIQMMWANWAIAK